MLYELHDVALDEFTVLWPDVLGAPRSAFTERNLPPRHNSWLRSSPPEPAPSTSTQKKLRYEVAGCPNYSFIDPDGPNITAWTLSGASYSEPTRCANNELFQTNLPFEVSFTPASLLA